MTRRKPLLYPCAMNHDGQIIEAEKAVPGQPYQCIGCGKTMLVRRGPRRRIHFAHTIDVGNCQPETVLHQLGKLAVKSGIQNALAEGKEYGLTWRCSTCEQSHRGNLAISPRKILEEHSFDEVRPDLLVISKNGKPLTAVEIIVTHELEQKTLAIYERLKLPVILIRPTWENFRELFYELKEVEVLNGPCLARHCPKCNDVMQRVVIQVCQGYQCYRCRASMPILNITDEDSGYTLETTRGMMEIARKLGITLDIRYSQTARCRYPMHICPACGAGQGNWYVTIEKDAEWTPEPVQGATVLSSRCERCDIWEIRETT